MTITVITHNCNFLKKNFVHIEVIMKVNPSNAELNPICYLLALLGAHDFLRRSTVSRTPLDE